MEYVKDESYTPPLVEEEEEEDEFFQEDNDAFLADLQRDMEESDESALKSAYFQFWVATVALVSVLVLYSSYVMFSK